MEHECGAGGGAAGQEESAVLVRGSAHGSDTEVMIPERVQSDLAVMFHDAVFFVQSRGMDLGKDLVGLVRVEGGQGQGGGRESGGSQSGESVVADALMAGAGVGEGDAGQGHGRAVQGCGRV